MHTGCSNSSAILINFDAEEEEFPPHSLDRDYKILCKGMHLLIRSEHNLTLDYRAVIHLVILTLHGEAVTKLIRRGV
jgi:hypothetical protein